MFVSCNTEFPSSDIAVMAAAVADYTPKSISSQKIKKKTDLFHLELIKTKDILQSLGLIKKASQVLVGFALETENEEDNAKDKLVRKNADLLVLNSLNDEGAGFGKDTNRVTIFERNNIKTEFEVKSKTLVAVDIAELIIKKLNEKI